MKCSTADPVVDLQFGLLEAQVHGKIGKAKTTCLSECCMRNIALNMITVIDSVNKMD